ncbi:MAG: hypothetical protein HYS98_06000 [Deltaproteobacteria bacterium]|nr:hypothetical protein [Deltaproteobacteria bacterium]
MSIFKVGTQIGKTVRNAARLRTILGVFARHGFGEVLSRMNLQRYVPTRLRKKTEEKTPSIGERLKLCFEELGPTFVKLGQLLSTRADFLPSDICQELKKLQDRVKPEDFSLLKPILEQEWNHTLASLFSSFDEQPVACASIAQVHLATLKNGADVVVKIQRPHIEVLIRNDIQLLHFLSSLLEKYIPETAVFNPKGIVMEFERSLKQELNFKIEANNMIRIRENMKKFEKIVIPQVYKEFSTSKILVQEKIVGLRLSDIEKIKSKGFDIIDISRVGIKAFYKQVLIDGIFHGDLHAGNLFITDDAKLALVDFGIVGHLSGSTRDHLTNMFLCLLNEEYELLVYEFLEIGTQKGQVDILSFQYDIKSILEPFYGMPLKDFNIGRILLDLTTCASRNNIIMSQDLMLVSKALITIEGMGKDLNPDFDILGEMGEFSKELMKERFNPQRIKKDLLWALKDFSDILRILPRHIKQSLRDQSSGSHIQRIEIENLENKLEILSSKHQTQGELIFLSSSLIASTLFLVHKIGPSFYDYSILGGIGLIFSLVVGFYKFLR